MLKPYYMCIYCTVLDHEVSLMANMEQLVGSFGSLVVGSTEQKFLTYYQ